ncbi:hypothetical protein EDD21DRAFT_290429, partial [Dissophora ornata]
WKKKWFVLRTSKLAYYKDSKEYVLLRIIDIRDIHKAAEVVVKNRAGVFVILTPKRTFTVQAESVAEMEEWIEAINQAKVQYELASSSDMGSSSYSGSTPQMEFPSSAPSTSAAAAALAASKKPELVKQGSGTFLPPRKQNQSPLSLSDPGLLTSTGGSSDTAANAPGSGLVTGEQLESKVVRQGFLLKLGKRSKTWRKKWFVLRGDKLTYYKNAKEYQPLGIIPLSNIIDSLQTDPVSKHK